MGLLCWASRSEAVAVLRYRKPSLWAVCEGGWGVVGAPVAGAERDLRDSSGSLGRGLLRGLGRSRARGRPSKRVTGAERLLEGR